MTQFNQTETRVPRLAGTGAKTGITAPIYTGEEFLNQADIADLLDNNAIEDWQSPMSPVQRQLLGTYGKQGLGHVSTSFTGYLGDWIGTKASKYMFDDVKYDVLLNLTDDPQQSGGFNENTLSKLIDLVEENNVAWEQWGYIFEAKTLGDFNDRLERTVLGSPETAQLGGTFGKVFGFASDTSGILLLGAALEVPLLAGTGLRGAAEAAATTSRLNVVGKSVEVSTEAAHWANSISRTGIIGRQTAVAIGEESVVKGIQYGTDPTFDADPVTVARDYMFSIGGWNILGGITGRSIAERAFTKEYNRALKTVTNPLGDVIAEYRDPLSMIHSGLDKTYIEDGSTAMLKSLEKLGNDIHSSYVGSVPSIGMAGIRASGMSDLEKATYELLNLIDKGVPGKRTTAATSRLLVEVMMNAHASGKRGADFWDEVIAKAGTSIPKKDAAIIRKAVTSGTAPTIGPDFLKGISELAPYRMMGELVDSLNAGIIDPNVAQNLDAVGTKSIAVSLLTQMTRLGWKPTHMEVYKFLREVGEGLRNPLTKGKPSGAVVVDEAMTAARILEIANSRLPADAQIAMTPGIKARIKSARMVIAGSGIRGSTGLPGAPTPAPGAKPPSLKVALQNLDDSVPILNRITDTLPGPLARIFNQSAGAMKSKNPAVRMAAFFGMNARRISETKTGVVRAQGRTRAEEGQHQVTKALSNASRTIARDYTRFALGKKPTDRVNILHGISAAFGRQGKIQKGEFYERVFRQLATGKMDDSVDAVNNSARNIRKILDETHDVAHKLKLPGFRNIKYVNYVSHMWLPSQLRKLADAPNGRAALIQLLEEAIKSKGGTDALGNPLRRVLLDNGKVKKFPDVKAAATAFADTLIAQSRGAKGAPLMEGEEEFQRALDALLSPLAVGKTSRSKFGKGRVDLDSAAEITTGVDLLGNGKTTLSILDLIDTDPNRVLRAYLTSVNGAIGDRMLLNQINETLAAYQVMAPVRINKKTGKPRKQKPIKLKSLDRLPALANKIARLDPARYGGPLSKADVQVLENIIDVVRMKPVVRAETPEALENASRIIVMMNYMRSGGAFVWGQVMEMYRLVGTWGLTGMVKELPMMKELVTNWWNLGEGAENTAMLLNSVYGIGTDRQLRTLLRVEPFERTVSTGVTGKIRRGVENMTAIYSDIEGLAPITTLSQVMASSAALHHLYDVGRGAAKRMDDATVRTWGLEPTEYDALIQYVHANAKTYRSLGRTRIKGFTSYNDVAAQDALKTFLSRATVTRIQDFATQGDMHKAAFSWWGQLLLQFKTFNIKGVDNLLFQNITRVTRGDAKARIQVAKEVAASLLGAWTVKYMLNYSDWWSANQRGEEEYANKIADEKLSAKGSVSQAMNYLGEAYLPLMVYNKMWTNLVDPDGGTESFPSRGIDMNSVPALDYLLRVGSVAYDAKGVALKELGNEEAGRDWTTSSLRKLFSIIPGNNLWYLKHFMRVSEKNLAEEFELYDRQLVR